MRLQLFEFEDLSWVPTSVRNGMTDFLQYLLTVTNFYHPVASILKDVLLHTKDSKIVDLCSGAGGAAQQVQKCLQQEMNQSVPFILTDKFPNLCTYTYLSKQSNGTISFKKDSIDATNVPTHIEGFRTMFSAAHHFPEDVLQSILFSTAVSKKGIAIFDGGSKNFLLILGILVLFPILFLVYTPFLKPFKWSRVFFTYVIPLIPLFTIWDGTVSVLRLHSLSSLTKICNDLQFPDYIWKVGKTTNRWGIKISYVVGYPFTPL